MRIVPELTWSQGDPPIPLDPRLMPLLEAVLARGSLAAAVQEMGLSYRSAWGLLRGCEESWGVPLVDLTRGRRATLAPAGRQLLDTHRTASARFAPLRREFALDVGPALHVRQQRAASLHLRIAASHDLALAAMREDVSRHGLEADVAFMGSVHALQAFHARTADVAGFHLPSSRELRDDVAALRRLLDARRDRLVAFVEREQGLILARSHARRVRRLRDIAARNLTFVNRQRGSGTRLIIEALMQREGIAHAAIRGYQTEEFTHRAVAATIASGGADAGFGVRAAAEEYDLAFVPLVHETYYLAVRSSALREAPLQQLVRYLASPAFSAIVQRLPGYRAAGAGRVLDIDVID